MDASKSVSSSCSTNNQNTKTTDTQNRHPNMEELRDAVNLTFLAYKGSTNAQKELGLMYLVGENSVKQNVWIALFWLSKAADQGCAESQFMVGNLFCSNRDVINPGKGLKWLQRAADQGHEKAQQKVQGIKDSTFNSMEKLAEQGKVHAQLSLGQWHLAEGDYEKAHFYYLKAYKQGSAQAAYELAHMFARGKGVAESDDVAFRWLLRAAKLGHPLAQELFDEGSEDEK